MDVARTGWTEVAIWGALAAIAVTVLLQFLFTFVSAPGDGAQNQTGKDAEKSVKAVPMKTQQGGKGRSAPMGKGNRHQGPHVQHIHHPLNLNTLKGHGDGVTGIAFTEDGRGLATACADRVVRVFKLEDVASKSFKFLRINLPTGICPVAVAFGEGASQLAMATVDSQGGGLCLFAAAEGQAAAQAREQGKLPPPELKWEHRGAHGGKEVLTLGGAPSTYGTGTGGVILATCSEATDVKLWTVADGKCVGSVDSNQLKNTMATLSPDGRFLAVAAFTADVKIWELVYGKDGSVREVARVMQLKGHKSAVTWLSFAWDCQRMVTASKDGTVKIWNINVRYHLDEDPKCLHTFPIPEPPPAEAAGRGKGAPHYDRIAVSPDNRVLATTVGSSLQWLSLETGAVLATAEHAHEGVISCIAWSPKPLPTEKGPRMILATGSADKKVKLWVEPNRLA